MSELLLLSLLVVEAFALGFAVRFPKWLHSILVFNMVLIMLFGEKLMSGFGLTTNVGNLFYATACASQIAIFNEEGETGSRLNIVRVLIALPILLVVVNLLARFPVVPGNEDVSQAVSRVTRFSPRILAGSFAGFAISQWVLISLYQRYRGMEFSRYFVAASGCQIVDSLVFFPVAFLGAGDGFLVGIVLVGIAVKITAMLALYPLLRIRGESRCGDK